MYAHTHTHVCFELASYASSNLVYEHKMHARRTHIIFIVRV